MKAMLRRARLRIPPPGQRGEALLVEVLVSSMVLVTAFSMAASLSGITTRALRTTEDLTSLALAVTENIADINDLASRYTYCSGKAGFTTCNGDTPGDATYYTPKNNPTLMDDFQATCGLSSFNSSLINEINTLPIPTGMNRIVSADANDLQARRFRVTFTSTATGINTGERVEVILPNVASFCP
jgi:hypothetical protein